MKISLQLKLGQHLSMTPQLQQAIKLLQLSTLDLQQEISQALESNPMLELIEHDDSDGFDSDAETSEDKERTNNETTPLKRTTRTTVKLRPIPQQPMTIRQRASGGKTSPPNSAQIRNGKTPIRAVAVAALTAKAKALRHEVRLKRHCKTTSSGN